MDNLQAPIKGERLRLEWGKTVVDAITRGRITGGTGVHISEDITGSSISLKKTWPKPRVEPKRLPFDLELRLETGQNNLYMYIGFNQHIVRRNGYVGAYEPVHMVDVNGWTLLDVNLDLSKVYYVTMYAPVVAKSGGPDCEFMVDVRHAGILEDTITEHIDMFSPVTIGVIIDGVLYQIHRGEISTYYTPFDSEISAFSSLQRIGNRQAQLFNFSDLESKATIEPDDLKADFVMRYENQNDVELQYCSVKELFDKLKDEMEERILTVVEPSIQDPYGLHNIPCTPENPGVWVWDGCEHEPNGAGGAGDGFVKRSYWASGGDESTCYGSAIGSGGDIVIDLDNSTLKYGWILEDASGRLSIDTSRRLLFDGEGYASVDWEQRKFFDGNDAAVADWANQQLINTAGKVTVAWEDLKLSDASGGLSVDWGNHQLCDSGGIVQLDYDKKELYNSSGVVDITMKWADRSLIGDWSVAALGSFSTPTLKVGGATYTTATEIINGTSYTFLVQV